MKELDIRALLPGNLKKDKDYNISIESILNDEKIVLRKFNENYLWNRKKASYFIESLMLGCEVHPLIMFKNEDKHYICDGVNRYLTIKRFVNNELVLDAKGLTKLRSLAGKKFKNLEKTKQEHFLHNVFLSVVYYYYENRAMNFKTLDNNEALAIEKQLYVRYNSGIRLSIEELQKAQFEGEYLTEKFRQYILEEPVYKDTLKQLYIGNLKKKRNEIDCILVDIRYLIASTYSNIRSYCFCTDKYQRINIFYEDKLCPKSNEEKDKMFDNFNICIELLKKLLELPEWKENKILHTKYFIQALYWIISLIQVEGKYPISKIDLKTLISYFAKNEEEYLALFITSEAHHRKLMIDRYLEMAKYFKKYYALDFMDRFKASEPVHKKEIIKDELTVKDLCYNLDPMTVSVSQMIENVKNFRYNIRPSYQRLESLKVDASSRVIESMLVGIEIPPIMILEQEVDGKTVYEVIDGQQRLLSILGYTNNQYKNELGEMCASEKDGYALSGLDIYYELNNRTYNLQKNHQLLDKEKKQDILNAKLYFVKMRGKDRKEAREHFVRLNSNINPLTNDFFYWNAIADQILLNKVEEINKNDYQHIIGKNNISFVNQKYIMALSYLMFQLKNNDNYHLKSNLSLSKVTDWLISFNKIKFQCYNKDEDEIGKQRMVYISSMEEVEQFLIKIDAWLKYIKKDIKEIFHIKNSTAIALKNLSCLFQLLENISLSDMKTYSCDIERILSEFYKNIHKKEVDVKKEEQYLYMSREKINILDSSVANETHIQIKQSI